MQVFITSPQGLRTIAVTAALGTALTVGSAPAVLAQTADPVVRACYVPASGTMYRIQAPGAPSECLKPSHVEFTLAGTANESAASLAKGGGGGGSDHGSLSGLTDDDHPQYLLTDGTRTSTDGFAVTGTLGQGTIPATGYTVRMMWYPGKGAFRAGRPNSDSWDDPKTGQFSIGMGDRTTALGPHSVALGYNSQATADYALAMQGGSASGYYARAIGSGTVASGTGATAIGGLSTASGSGAIALGGNTVASGPGAIAAGSRADARGYNSIVIGNNSVADAYAAMVIGSVSQSSGNTALAMGYNVRATGDYSVAVGKNATTNGRRGAFVFGDASTLTGLVPAAADNQFVVRAQRFWLGNSNSVTATSGRFIETSTGAYLSSGGAWVSSSDSTKKHRWADVDGEAVLNTLAALPIRTWSYREEADSVRHIGPTAQEFRSAFGMGDTDRAIATVDADGVALAAAKALEVRTRELRERMAELEALTAELSELRDELAAMRAELEAREQ
jgi:trimeric autotransporter adhesin